MKILKSFEALQKDVREWMQTCFGPEISSDVKERSYRFLEEGLELVQAGGLTKEEALTLVDYVYSRPRGVVKEEVGDVLLTLTALANPYGVNLSGAATTVMRRAWANIDKIRAKQASKPRNSPLAQ